MERNRTSAKGAALAIVSVGILAGALLVAGPAAAAPAATPAQAAALAERLGDQAVGTYLDSRTGRMTVAVTSDQAAATVRSAGAAAKRVRYGKAELASARAALEANAKLPGTAWGTDPVANQLVVSYDSTVTGARLDQLKSVVARLGDRARLEPTPGVFTLNIAGGDPIFSAGGRCSLGFSVRVGSDYGFITAGHCGVAARYWYRDEARTDQLGFVGGSSFPGNDYALVRFTGAPVPDGTVNLYNGTSQDITTSGNAYVGESIRRSGGTTRTRSGTVNSLEVTVNFADAGSVSGLIGTNACAERGDSGGPLFDGSKALGVLSGGSGNCTTGGQSFYQPIAESLAAFGATLY